MVVVSRQVCHSHADYLASRKFVGAAGCGLASITRNSKSRLDGAGGCPIVYIHAHYPGRRLFSDTDPDWINQESNGLGSLAPACAKRRIVLASVSAATTGSATLRKDVLMNIQKDDV